METPLKRFAVNSKTTELYPYVVNGLFQKKRKHLDWILLKSAVKYKKTDTEYSQHLLGFSILLLRERKKKIQSWCKVSQSQGVTAADRRKWFNKSTDIKKGTVLAAQYPDSSRHWISAMQLQLGHPRVLLTIYKPPRLTGALGQTHPHVLMHTDKCGRIDSHWHQQHLSGYQHFQLRSRAFIYPRKICVPHTMNNFSLGEPSYI